MIATAVEYGSVAGVGIGGQGWNVVMAAFLEPEGQVH